MPGNATLAIRDDGKVCAVGGWDGKYVRPIHMSDPHYEIFVSEYDCIQQNPFDHWALSHITNYLAK